MWELRTAGCTSAAGPRPTPHPRPCRDPAPVAWAPASHSGGAALSTSEGDGNRYVSLKDFLGRTRWVTDTPHLEMRPAT